MALGGGLTPAWMLDTKNWWYITYTDGSWRKIYARSEADARAIFMSEGDHAWEFGQTRPISGRPR